jgi:hypothetical protein
MPNMDGTLFNPGWEVIPSTGASKAPFPAALKRRHDPAMRDHGSRHSHIRTDMARLGLLSFFFVLSKTALVAACANTQNLQYGPPQKPGINLKLGLER